MTSSGDALLFAVSASRDLPWASFRAAVDATCVPDGLIASDMRYVRSEAGAVGDALGHWEVVTLSGDRRVVIAPPVLARLPWPGFPRAVLCGSRSPDTLSEVQRECAQLAGVEVRVASQIARPYAPSRIEVIAASEDRMAGAAGAIGIEYSPNPAAWSIAVASCSLGQYLDSLKWDHQADLNWDRRDFDAGRMAFTRPEADETTPPLRLSAYSHPSGWAWRDWLWRDGTAAVVDRDWGRYAMLRAAARRVLAYDRREGVTLVPRQAPLPKLLARALTLSSGQPASVREGEGLGLRAYSAVPLGVFDLVAAKVGQDLQV